MRILKNQRSTLLLAIGVFVSSLVIVVFSRSDQFTRLDDPVPAFPGAMGFGSMTAGGRFGRIVFVTNLFDTTDINDPNYLGSLRWAVEHVWEDAPDILSDEGRIIVFRVGGTINLSDRLIIKNPYTTIAGQSAPGGIMLRGDELTIATHDVIIRGLRIRVGDEGSPTCCRDGISIGTYYADSDVYNVIVDHSSVSWAIDENFSIWSESSDDFTVYDISLQWNIISEGLHDSIHVDEEASVTDEHSMGLIIGNRGSNISIHHNLFAHNWGRNPRIDGIDQVEIINNLIYGWENAAVEITDNPVKAHLIGNFFKATDRSSLVELEIYSLESDERGILLMDNVVDNPLVNSSLFYARLPKNESSSGYEFEVFPPSGINFSTAQEAYNSVLANSGALVPFRDTVDQRVVNDVIRRSGGVINSQDEVGSWPDIVGLDYPQDTDNDGIPDDWEIEHGIDPQDPTDANNYYMRSPGGYTWIEEYVNSLIPLPVDE